MMKEHLKYLKFLLKKLLLILVFFSLLRLLFYILHHNEFDISLSELPGILFYGIRFDLSVVFTANLLIILLYLLPFPFRSNRFYRSSVNFIFILINIIAFSIYAIDFEFFNLYQRRISYPELSSFLENFNMGVVFEFIVNYWIPLIICLFFSCLFILINKNIRFRKPRLSSGWNYYTGQTLIFLVFMGLSILLGRGGLQMKPLDIVMAGHYTKSKNISLVTNNPFVLIKTLDRESFDQDTSESCPELYSGKKYIKSYYDPGKDFNSKNIVIIILESFSKEFIGSLNPNFQQHQDYHDYTPFLDSLINHSFVCTNAFANDENSIRALPNIISGIPSLMKDNLPYSLYIQNHFSSLSSLLKEKGYHSSFFHGGKNGTMSFDALVKLNEFDRYYGMNEYPGKEDYDGHWGIYDDKFFGFMADKLDETKQPFLSVVFSLSNHAPYKVPERLQSNFQEYELPIHRVAAYTDYSLKEFFEKASRMDWFSSTVFVITADHVPRPQERYKAFYQKGPGSRMVPIIFYDPGNPNLNASFSETAQQIDIMPSLLDYLNYDKQFFAFGSSLFDSSAKRFAITYLGNNRHLYIKDSLAIYTKNDEISYAYLYQEDSLLNNKIKALPHYLQRALKQEIFCFRDFYVEAMIRNKLTFERNLYHNNLQSWAN
ncbi:MAG: LTA synthase family protein [Bacteroidales bacterium]|nr:LTA synthase family protein [Bacteroidales bacterium]MCF8388113.1 LTA synthase family protein [Bacteroidales bacterium]MCF8398772.1 LTA synthase family protein [Bacteroidales bacterium]